KTRRAELTSGPSWKLMCLPPRVCWHESLPGGGRAGKADRAEARRRRGTSAGRSGRHGRYTGGMAIRQPRQPRIKPPTRPKWQSKYHGVRMTPEEYLALPEEKPYLEYVDGVVLQKPMPTEEHGELAFRVGHPIQLWLGTRPGRIGVEVRAKLGELPNYRLPDVSYWKPGIPRGEGAPPTVAVEIRSP